MNFFLVNPFTKTNVKFIQLCIETYFSMSVSHSKKCIDVLFIANSSKQMSSLTLIFILYILNSFEPILTLKLSMFITENLVLRENSTFMFSIFSGMFIYCFQLLHPNMKMRNITTEHLSDNLVFFFMDPTTSVFTLTAIESNKK